VLRVLWSYNFSRIETGGAERQAQVCCGVPIAAEIRGDNVSNYSTSPAADVSDIISSQLNASRLQIDALIQQLRDNVTELRAQVTMTSSLLAFRMCNARAMKIENSIKLFSSFFISTLFFLKFRYNHVCSTQKEKRVANHTT